MKNVNVMAVMLFLLIGINSKAQTLNQKGGLQLNFGLAYFGLDYAIHKDVTIGGIASLYYGKDDFVYLSAVGDYHFNSLLNLPTEWDFYAGLNAGLVFRPGLYFDIHVGGRYFFADKWAVNLQLGGGVGANGRIGVTYKL